MPFTYECPSHPTLMAYARNELPAQSNKHWDRHIQRCKACREYLDGLPSTRQLTKEEMTPPAVDEKAFQALLAASKRHEPLTQHQLELLCSRILAHGPDRVVVDDHGRAEAPRNGAPWPAIVFVRHDGWSLGAPEGLEDVAERIWDDCWVGVMLPDQLPVPYATWKAKKAG